jgi:hypothetical protein
MMNSRYTDTISEIQTYFLVSYDCAKYMFHRAIRHKKRDDKYLEWTLALQNAIVKADKCLGFNWDLLLFGQEEKILANHGIHLSDMEKYVFKWGDNDEWTTVKKKRKNKKLIANLNIYT